MKKIRALFFLLFAFAFTIATNCHAENVFFAVTNSLYRGDKELTYPIFSKGNAIAAKKINKFVESIIPTFIKDERKAYQEDIYVKSKYKITYNYNDYLSIVFTMEYGIKGWPQTVMRGYAFNSNTGDMIHAKDLNVTAWSIRNKLHIMAQQKNISLNESNKIRNVPDNFYYDNDFNLHFIFDKGTIATEADGIIDLNMDAY
ncbi:MAG: DUF4163 domain-containing protein [Desulfovibrio sp.]|nr:DUF4163 domain-containing protein [Desulfovibrio sp.]